MILTPGTRETDESKIGLKQIGSPEEKGRKKLPTIIKYAGQGKDVYLCGKKLMKCIRPFIYYVITLSYTQNILGVL